MDSIQKPDAAQVFLERRGWQKWIFPLLLEGSMASDIPEDTKSSGHEMAEEESKQFSSGPQSLLVRDDMESSLFKLTMGIFATVHYGSLLIDHDKDTESSRMRSNEVHKTINLLSDFNEGWTRGTASISRVMLMTILNKVRIEKTN